MGVRQSLTTTRDPENNVVFCAKNAIYFKSVLQVWRTPFAEKGEKTGNPAVFANEKHEDRRKNPTEPPHNPHGTTTEQPLPYIR